MAWVYVDDHFDEHPKMARVGPIGWGVWLAGLAYCNRNLTDGFIPWNVARTLCSFEVVHNDGRLDTLAVTSGMSGDDLSMEWAINLMLEMGPWKEVRQGDRITGYRIHDYLDWQKSRQEILSERERSAKRQADYRQRHAKRNAVTNAVTNAVSNAVSNGPVTSAPHPNPKEEPPNVGSSTTAAAAANSQTSSLPAAQQFAEFWSAYPRRAGGNPRRRAEKAWTARIRDGESPDEILAGLQRYRQYVEFEGKVGTEFVKQASTFLGPDRHWREPWDPPANGRKPTKRRPIDDYTYAPTEEVPQWPK